MAFLKVYRLARREGIGAALSKALKILPLYFGRLSTWKVRRCRCCDRITIFLSRSDATEFRVCLFCSANERYELLAIEINERYGKSLAEKKILELDPHSPLRRLLSRSDTYVRSFYDVKKAPGSLGADGSFCEDITRLTFEDSSFDLIISSDVLEHVPCLDKAFQEMARVLKPGGAHLFTVPPRAKTLKRAEVVAGKVCHIEPPEYHCDPLVNGGILTFWDIGPDLPELICSDILDIRIVRGPIGQDGRVVWIAERRAT
jgi:SAM-dependent methyltransferase